MTNYTQITRDEITELTRNNAETIIEQEEVITRDTLIDIRNGKYVDEEYLVSIELLVSDEYVYDWEQIQNVMQHSVENPIEAVKLKGLQKLYQLTWEHVTDMIDYEIT